jgi:hypothetical protein
MNIYDRIINILLESRIEDYTERLDERIKANKDAKNALIDRVRHQEAPGPGGDSDRERLAQFDHSVRLAGAKRAPRTPTTSSQKRARGRANLRDGDTYIED